MTKPGDNLTTAWEVATLIILDMHFYNLNNLLLCYNTYDMYLKIMCDFLKVIICRDYNTGNAAKYAGTLKLEMTRLVKCEL